MATTPKSSSARRTHVCVDAPARRKTTLQLQSRKRTTTTTTATSSSSSSFSAIRRTLTTTMMMIVAAAICRRNSHGIFSSCCSALLLQPSTSLSPKLLTSLSSTTSMTMMSTSSTSSSSTTTTPVNSNKNKGRLLVLGGTGFLGGTICRRAILEGYQVTSLSRRGVPPPTSSSTSSTSSTATDSSLSSTTTTVGGTNRIEYRRGDARRPDTVAKILAEHDDYVGVIHAIGLLFDDASGLGTYNRFVSGSGSVPDNSSTYDAITRQSAFYAIDATIDYASAKAAQMKDQQQQEEQDGNTSRRFPFVFTSAAEAGWPDVVGGPQIEQYLAPEWLRRYLDAKRAVESKLLDNNSNNGKSNNILRPIIPRPSLIYSLDRPASYVPVGAFFVGNRIGLPFVDRPVTVQALSNAIVRSINDQSTVEGILRYEEIDRLSQ